MLRLLGPSRATRTFCSSYNGFAAVPDSGYGRFRHTCLPYPRACILLAMELSSEAGFRADPELVAHLSEAYGLDPSLAERIAEDILIAFGDTLEEWVRSRHIRLQRRGLDNQTIYRTIAAELKERRFAAEPQSLRQIRRLIYG